MPGKRRRWSQRRELLVLYVSDNIRTTLRSDPTEEIRLAANAPPGEHANEEEGREGRVDESIGLTDVEHGDNQSTFGEREAGRGCMCGN